MRALRLGVGLDRPPLSGSERRWRGDDTEPEMMSGHHHLSPLGGGCGFLKHSRRNGVCEWKRSEGGQESHREPDMCFRLRRQIFAALRSRRIAVQTKISPLREDVRNPLDALGMERQLRVFPLPHGGRGTGFNMATK